MEAYVVNPRLCVSSLFAIGLLPFIAFAGPAEEARFRQLLDRGLVLSSDPDCAEEVFHLEMRFRIIQQDAPTMDVRVLGQRSKDRVALALLSPEGFASAVLVGRTFMVVGDGALKVFPDAQFRCDTDPAPSGALGIHVAYSRRAGPSRLHVDLRSIARCFMVDDAEYGWDERCGRCWVSTPRGAHLSLFLNRDTATRGFPVRALTARALGVKEGSRIELAISDI